MIRACADLAEAYAIPDPKQVQVTRTGILVFTGDDIPPLVNVEEGPVQGGIF